MFNDIDWARKGNEENCISNSQKIMTYAKRFSQGHRTFFALETKRSGNEIATTTLRNMEFHRFTDGATIQGNRSASLHKCQCLESWNLTHSNADVSNTELLFRIIHSVNQFSIYGTVSNWCEEFGLWPTAKENSANKEILKSVNSQEVNSLVGAPRTGPASGNRLRECLASFAAQGRSWYEL